MFRMKIMFKRRIALLLALLFCVGMVFCGCTPNENATDAGNGETTSDQNDTESGEGDGSDKITLSFSHFYTDDNTAGQSIAFRAAIEKFEKDYPNVELVQDITPHDNYLTKIKTLAAANSLPDVFLANGSMIQSFVQGDLMMSLDDIMEADKEWSDGFINGSFKEFIINDKIYGIPIQYFATHVIYYNKGIFEECGINEFPKDWDSFLDAVQTLKDNGYIPMSMGNKAQWVVESCFYSTLADRYTGSEWFDEVKNRTGDAKFTDPEFVASLQTLKDLTDMGLFNNDAQSIDDANMVQLYANGEAGMMAFGAWGIGTIKALATEELFENTEVAVLPGGMEGQLGSSEAASGGAGWAHGLNTNLSGARLEAATTLLKYLHNAETATIQIEASGQPSYTLDISSVNLDSLSKKYYTMLATIDLTPIYDIQLDASLVDIVYSGLQEVMIGQKTPEEVAQKLQEEQERLIKDQN